MKLFSVFFITSLLLLAGCQKHEEKTSGHKLSAQEIAIQKKYTQYETKSLDKALKKLSFQPIVPKSLPVDAKKKSYEVLKEKKDSKKETFIFKSSNRDHDFINISYSNSVSSPNFSGDNISKITLKNGSEAFLTQGFMPEKETIPVLILSWNKDGREYFISYNNTQFSKEENEKEIVKLAEKITIEDK